MKPPSDTGGRSSRPRSKLFRGLALTCSLLAACAAGEGLLRLVGYSSKYFNPVTSFYQPDPDLGYSGKPDFQGRFKSPNFDVQVVHNGEGFRRQEHRHPPARSDQRVFVFGDSFTWGWGVGQGKVYTDQMSLRLSDHEVLNYGLNGSGTVQQFAAFQRYVEPQLAPGNTVLIAFCSNDFSDNVHGTLHGEVVDGEVRLAPPRRFGSPVKDALKEHSYLFNLFLYCFDMLNAKMKQNPAAQAAKAQQLRTPYDAKYPEDSPEFLVTKHFLNQFKQACQRKQARLLVVDIGTDLQLAKITKTLGIETVQVLPFFLEAQQSGRIAEWQIPRDCHWNETGHALVADVLANYLRGTSADSAPPNDPPLAQLPRNTQRR